VIKRIAVKCATAGVEAGRPVSFKMAFLHARRSPSFATAAAAFSGGLRRRCRDGSH
jgi:hypothetical protein